MKRNHLTLTLVAALILVLAALPASAQRPARGFGQRAMVQAAGQADPLARLKNALQAAGAAALTSEQESSINTLITNFRASHTPPAPNTALQSARTAYDDAILSGKYNDEAAQTIVKDMADKATARFKDAANFAISVVSVLSTDQTKLLVTKFGNGRVVQLLESLAGGPGFGLGPGAGPRQGAMGMRRP